VTRQPVSSTAIASVGYEPAMLTLEIEFHSGSVYRYFDVPEPVYRAFMAADSKGTYFAEAIRDAYRFERT
jgi:KTSC domain